MHPMLLCLTMISERLGDTYADPDGGFHEMVSHDNL